MGKLLFLPPPPQEEGFQVEAHLYSHNKRSHKGAGRHLLLCLLGEHSRRKPSGSRHTTQAVLPTTGGRGLQTSHGCKLLLARLGAPAGAPEGGRRGKKRPPHPFWPACSWHSLIARQQDKWFFLLGSTWPALNTGSEPVPAWKPYGGQRPCGC